MNKYERLTRAFETIKNDDYINYDSRNVWCDLVNYAETIWHNTKIYNMWSENNDILKNISKEDYLYHIMNYQNELSLKHDTIIKINNILFEGEN